MLKLNLKDLSNSEIVRLVSRRCRRFGHVMGVSIHRRTLTRTGAYALVSMASVDEVKKLIHGLRATLIAGSALVPLAQDVPAKRSRPASVTVLASARGNVGRRGHAKRPWLAASARYLLGPLPPEDGVLH